ncbi:MAG TPA: amino acid permease [Terriglobales bacterium]|nr:amino acid permease [Terriglobales bacterium]
MPAPAHHARVAAEAKLARKLGLFDATMLVMGGIVGSGIFINSYVVANRVHTPALILAAWAVGGVIALLGAFIYAELSARMPEVGGQYAYIREAYHPGIAFLYGWGLLLVTQTGGMAAVSITFARYTLELTGAHLPDALVAVLALAVLTVINCLGVRTGGTVQSALMVMKIAAITALVVLGWALVSHSQWTWTPLLDHGTGTAGAFGSAMIPVLFSYGGWQTSCFIAGEMRRPERDLPRGLLIGVVGVIVLYVATAFVYVRALGAAGLAATSTPASAVMRLALGQTGSRFMAATIAVSGLGFLSQSILTAPRVYFAMAEDGLFFRAIATVSRRTRVPVVAIILQSLWTMVIALSGKYEQILNYVVSVDFIFFGLTATTLFVFRYRDRHAQFAGVAPRASGRGSGGFRVPGHPFSTAMFTAACFLVVGNTIYHYPANSMIGVAILAAGVPVYLLWRRPR